MIILTLTSGIPAHVDPAHIQTISRAGDRTDVTLTGAEYPIHVREAPADIARLILAWNQRGFFLTELIRSQGMQIAAFSLSGSKLVAHHVSLHLESVH